MFGGSVTEVQRVGDLLTGLQDLMEVTEQTNVELCAMNGVPAHPLVPFKDAVKITQDASFYMRVHGLAGAGGEDIIRTISKARVQK